MPDAKRQQPDRSCAPPPHAGDPLRGGGAKWGRWLRHRLSGIPILAGNVITFHENLQHTPQSIHTEWPHIRAGSGTGRSATDTPPDEIVQSPRSANLPVRYLWITLDSSVCYGMPSSRALACARLKSRSVTRRFTFRDLLNVLRAAIWADFIYFGASAARRNSPRSNFSRISRSSLPNCGLISTSPIVTRCFPASIHGCFWAQLNVCRKTNPQTTTDRLIGNCVDQGGSFGKSTKNGSNPRRVRRKLRAVLYLVAGAGFEPATFGL